MIEWFTTFVNAVRPGLPKDHHELVLLIAKTTFVLWTLMESIQTLMEKYSMLRSRF